MMPENVIGICGEATTYRDEYRGYKVTNIEKRDCKDRKSLKSKKLETLESHDTFEKLDYDSRLPFDALWKPKEIVGTDPRAPFHKNCRREVNENLNVSRFKPIELMSPAVNLNDVKNPETRKLLVDCLYKSTMTRAAEEVWRNFERNYDKCIPDRILEEPEDPVTMKMKLVPAELKNAARKWDFLENRRLVDRKKLEEVKPCNLRSPQTNINVSKKLEHQRVISELIKDGKKLRIPYEKLPLSYSGNRTSIALGVPLVRNKLSLYHPDLTISQALVSRNS